MVEERNATINGEDNPTVTKNCVGCGIVFLAIRGISDDTNYCSSSCEERHSIFNPDIMK